VRVARSRAFVATRPRCGMICTFTCSSGLAPAGSAPSPRPSAAAGCNRRSGAHPDRLPPGWRFAVRRVPASAVPALPAAAPGPGGKWPRNTRIVVLPRAGRPGPQSSLKGASTPRQP
jgi:hypothetical protein